MLGMLGSFQFEQNKAQFDKIAHEISFDYSDSSRIGNYAKTQAIGKSNESFTFEGTLILQKVNAIDELIKQAEQKVPVTLTFVNGTILVTIRSIKRDMDTFLNTGEFIKQDFSCTVKRWYK